MNLNKFLVHLIEKSNTEDIRRRKDLQETQFYSVIPHFVDQAEET
jgi:hypothetical protein